MSSLKLSMARMLLIAGVLAVLSGLAEANENCSCGFYDESTGNLFTESLITYFNETNTLPSGDFVVQSYANRYDKGWNSIYRQGASAGNVILGNASDNGDSQTFPDSSLELFVSPSDGDHLVVGGGIETVRRDIQYGSFKSLVRSPRPWAGGSAISMMLYFNDSQQLSAEMMNTNNASTAWTNLVMADEFPTRSLGVNYTTLSNTSDPTYGGISPWDFVELRVDWTEKELNYSIGGHLARSISREENSALPSVPMRLLFKHWSDGDTYLMQGPPESRSGASVGWIRSFFNSSTMSSIQQKEFAERCSISDACLMSDTTIRGSSAYSKEATIAWKQKASDPELRIFAIVVVSFCAAVGLVVLLNGALRQWSERRKTRKRQEADTTTAPSTPPTPKASSITGPYYSMGQSLKDIDNEKYINAAIFNKSAYSNHTALSSTVGSSVPSISEFSTPARRNSIEIPSTTATNMVNNSINDRIDRIPMSAETGDKKKDVDVSVTQVRAEGDITPAPLAIAPVRQRIDYIAGIVVVCTILVSFLHFSLTYLPAIESGYDAHYKSELWARKTIQPFLFNQIWIGLFFTTSTRFMVSGYLRSGDLKGIADKTVRRIFRLMVPIVGVVLLEYFLINCGITKWLQYLPSVSWSTWPYVIQYSNFGIFLNEVLQLVYLIPNAYPQIIYNYCTGVLWTIPVQIQGSWVCLLAVIVVFQIKTLWKRLGYYTFCILVNWYARSWGSYFWAGLAMTDLDVVCQYRNKLKNRFWVRSILVVACLATSLGMLSTGGLEIWTSFSLPKVERGIHPDPSTGLPLRQTSDYRYPDYFEPRPIGLIFALATQTAVELSPFIQSLMSSKLLMIFFPHTFTIYLIHGTIFWSIGPLVCVQLAAHGIPYWANMLVTAVVCYAALFAALPIVTPAIELLGISVSVNIAQQSRTESAPKKATLFPYTRDLLLTREGADPHTTLATEEIGKKED